MPKLWNETIDAHRHAVREAILDAAAGLIESGGLRAVTMSQLAERAGIGRATLYKYFPDAEAVLGAWHERQISTHLHQLAEAAHQPGTAAQRLTAAATAYADLGRQRPRRPWPGLNPRVAAKLPQAHPHWLRSRG